VTEQAEAFSRVLIDQALKDSGWNLLDPLQVRFELQAASGRADYVLSAPHGPLCILEAKRKDLDPYDAKEQARTYAENLKAPFGGGATFFAQTVLAGFPISAVPLGHAEGGENGPGGAAELLGIKPTTLVARIKNGDSNAGFAAKEEVKFI